MTESRHHRAADRGAADALGLARAVEELPVAMIVYDGPDHVVAGANRAARAFLGDRPDILGRPAREVLPELAGQRLLAMCDQVYASGEPFTASEWRVLVDRTGRGEPDERHLDFTLLPLRAADGQVCGVAAQFSDVTEMVLRRDGRGPGGDGPRDAEVGRDVVLALQRSLLPAGLPVLSGVRIAAHYMVSGTEQSAGGDWYDAVPLGGRLAVVVGDVVGHGVEASAAMGQLRALLEEYLLDGADLAAVLARLDRFAMRVPGARGTTVCLALLDPVTGSVDYACAGHPPPLVVAADGTTRFLPVPGGGPLGVAGPLPVVARTRLRPGDLLLCYSDGLVQRAGRHLGDAVGGLAEVASTALTVGTPSLRAAEPADRVAELTVERMTRDGYDDDVTLVVVRLTGQAPLEFEADLPAEPVRLSALRRRLEDWLVGTGAGEPDVVAVQIAVLEAVTNAIEHAYDEPGGWVRVEGMLDDVGRACMTVIDHGRWRPAPADPGNRGRGLMMMRGCMDTVEIETSEEGTTLLLDRHLHRAPVVTGARPVPVRSGPAVGLSVKVELSVEPRLSVFGPVDAGSVDELRRQLRLASRGGALPLTVDLRHVTHLASAGVQLLFDFVEEMTADGRKLALVAPPSCPAWRVIALTGLDRVVTVTEV